MLRESTAVLHQAVDGAVGQFSDMAGYRRYLRALSLFRLPLERRWAEMDWPAALLGWRPTTVAASIEQDLVDLSLEPVAVTASNGSSDTADLLGMFYVVQGATLGAQILLGRALELGLTRDYGARHLSVQADGLATWRSFLEVLESAPDIDMNRVVSASQSTFQRAEIAFKSCYA